MGCKGVLPAGTWLMQVYGSDPCAQAGGWLVSTWEVLRHPALPWLRSIQLLVFNDISSFLQPKHFAGLMLSWSLGAYLGFLCFCFIIYCIIILFFLQVTMLVVLEQFFVVSSTLKAANLQEWFNAQSLKIKDSYTERWHPKVSRACKQLRVEQKYKDVVGKPDRHLSGNVNKHIAPSPPKLYFLWISLMAFDFDV